MAQESESDLSKTFCGLNVNAMEFVPSFGVSPPPPATAATETEPLADKTPENAGNNNDQVVYNDTIPRPCFCRFMCRRVIYVRVFVYWVFICGPCGLDPRTRTHTNITHNCCRV